MTLKTLKTFYDRRSRTIARYHVYEGEVHKINYGRDSVINSGDAGG